MPDAHATPSLTTEHRRGRSIGDTRPVVSALAPEDHVVAPGVATSLLHRSERECPGSPPAIETARRRRSSTPTTLVEVFRSTAIRFAGNIALVGGNRETTYAQLEREAEELAARLAESGIGRGDRVGIRVPSGTADLYRAILGVLFSGAAYVPVDFDDPEPRAEMIWNDVAVAAIVTTSLEIVPRRDGSERHDLPEPDDDCWVIYTSGSSGAPKGVAVRHRSAAAFVDAESYLWRVAPTDRVFAGLSPAFDASCEEMWLAWRNGAALVACPRDLVRAGPDLGPWLVDRRITVVSTVPTLAAMWDAEVLSGIRLLILGGEPLPRELGWRLARHSEVWNTYGPTEATVVSTAARVLPGRPISIGTPLRGWKVAIVDQTGARVQPGSIGELVIAGVGLGRYLDPVLDAERFFPMEALTWPRGYRTGDLVREGRHGLEFLGRRDDQVKIGGRRIELGEIDAHLCAAPGVVGAATVCRATASAHTVLVGYYVGTSDPASVRAHLADRLPAGIVPALVRLPALPTKTSGKIDRAALPWPPPDAEAASEGSLTTSASADPSGDTAMWLAQRWMDQLGPIAIGPNSDFFDLGGTSLGAAQLVSAIRGRFPSAAVADVYRYRPLRRLAARLDATASATVCAAPRRPPGRKWGAVQLIGVLGLLAFTGVEWLGGVLAYNQWSGTGLRIGWLAIAAGWLLFASVPGRSALLLVARRLLVARITPGRYPKQGWLACRLWFLERLTDALHLDVLAGTPWATRYARLNGATIGTDARLATLPPPAALVHVGDHATLEADVDLRGWWIEGDDLVVGKIEIGADARVGARCHLMPGAFVGVGAEVEPGTVVAGTIPAGERWSGSPAARVGLAGETWPEAPCDEATPAAASRALFAFGLVVLSLLPIIAALPDLAVLRAVGNLAAPGQAAATIALAAPLLAALYLACYAGIIAIGVRSVGWLLREGSFADCEPAAWALWFNGALMNHARGVLFPLFSSIYTRGWLRLLGIRVGRRAEVSTAVGLNRLVRLGDASFVTDDVVFASARARRGRIDLAPITVGDRTFLGNGAILRSGTRLGADSLVGLLSTPPLESADSTSWLGFPALELPRIPDHPDPARTTSPPSRLVLARGAMEFVRILLPSTVSIVLGGLVFASLELIGSRAGLAWLVVASPVVVLSAGTCAAGITVALKWLLMGRYRRGEHPLWSFFVWRDEIVNTCQEQLAGAWLLEAALGTPLIPTYLRAMGCRVGKGVRVESLNVTEFDLVDLGDNCVVNRGGCVETHLFHDRLMRIGPAVLGAHSTLGPDSAVLPDTVVGEGCVVGPRSIVLRGERLPRSSRWLGAPVQSWG